MNIYNYEKMKKKALDIIPTIKELQEDPISFHVLLNNPNSKKEALNNIQNEIKKTIENWDIRSYKSLIEICRKKKVYIIPKKNSTNLIPEINEHGEWVLYENCK